MAGKIIYREVVMVKKAVSKDGRNIYKCVGELTTWENSDGTTSKSMILYQNPEIRFAIWEDKPRAKKVDSVSVNDELAPEL